MENVILHQPVASLAIERFANLLVCYLWISDICVLSQNLLKFRCIYIGLFIIHICGDILTKLYFWFLPSIYLKGSWKHFLNKKFNWWSHNYSVKNLLCICWFSWRLKMGGSMCLDYGLFGYTLKSNILFNFPDSACVLSAYLYPCTYLNTEM